MWIGFGISATILSTALASQMLLQHITFDYDPEHLHRLTRLTCLAKRFDEGRSLLDEETFQGKGRTCVTCHSVKTGTFSADDARRRLARNRIDPLFLGDGLDDGVHGTSRITE